MNEGMRKITCRRCKCTAYRKTHVLGRRTVITLQGEKEVEVHKYMCVCGRYGTWITPDIAPIGTKYGWDVIEVALDVLDKGGTLVEASEALAQHGLKVAQTTIHGWRRFGL